MVFTGRPDFRTIFQTPSGPVRGLVDSTKTAKIVLMAGFEAFNLALYKKAAERLYDICPSIELTVFTDRDIATQPEVVAAALKQADAFFGSLIFDYDQVIVVIIM